MGNEYWAALHAEDRALTTRSLRLPHPQRASGGEGGIDVLDRGSVMDLGGGRSRRLYRRAVNVDWSVRPSAVASGSNPMTTPTPHSERYRKMVEDGFKAAAAANHKLITENFSLQKRVKELTGDLNVCDLRLTAAHKLARRTEEENIRLRQEIEELREYATMLELDLEIANDEIRKLG